MMERINRNIVECKADRSTYLRKLAQVLIETQWNVKDVEKRLSGLRRSINRNIVECKGKSLKVVTSNKFVLIETQWNIKIKKTKHRERNCAVLIETQWNVKEIKNVINDCYAGY